MASVRETVDGIRVYVAGGRRVPANVVGMRADAYARACWEVNGRLRQCQDSLQRGFRVDAIQIAEEEPNLLDMVALLDFPELAGWKQLCRTHQLIDAPELLIEVASAVNEAYAVEQSLAALMMEHRVLALARAPLDQRLAVMRQIAQADPVNTFWEDDIRHFEQARLDEIRKLLVPAFRGNDLATVQCLADEAENPAWRIAVPPLLRSLLQQAVAQLQANRRIEELRAMLLALNDARARMAHAECRGLLDQWAAIVGEATVPADLQEQIDGIIGWLQDEAQAALPDDGGPASDECILF